MSYIEKYLNDVLPEPTSHHIGVKQVLLANGETSTAVTQIAKNTLKAGERVEEHVHPTMDEHYLCFSGEGVLWVEDKKIAFTKVLISW